MSVFDDAFRQAAETCHDVFGTPALYTPVGGDEIPLQFSVESLEQMIDVRQSTRSNVWVLRGTVLKSAVAEPRIGDRLELLDDSDRVYALKQTPTSSKDGLQWSVEFRHESAQSRGGQDVFPVLL